MQGKNKQDVDRVLKNKQSDKEDSLKFDEAQKLLDFEFLVQSLELATQNLEEVIQQFEQSSDKSISSLVEHLESLKKVNYVLNRIPGKIGESLNVLVPDISQAIYAKILDDFDDVMSARTKKLENFDIKLDETLTKLEIHNTKTLKMGLLKFALNAFILVCIASSTTYFMLQKFPSKISINDTNNVEISGSDVTVWGRGLKIIEKIKDKEFGKR